MSSSVVLFLLNPSCSSDMPLQLPIIDSRISGLLQFFFHSLGVFLVVKSLLKIFVNSSIKRFPLYFQSSLGMSSKPGTFPFLILYATSNVIWVIIFAVYKIWTIFFCRSSSSTLKMLMVNNCSHSFYVGYSICCDCVYSCLVCASYKSLSK